MRWWSPSRLLHIARWSTVRPSSPLVMAPQLSSSSCWIALVLCLTLAIHHVSPSPATQQEPSEGLEAADDEHLEALVETMLRNYQNKLLLKSPSLHNSFGPPIWIGDSPPPPLPSFEGDDDVDSVPSLIGEPMMKREGDHVHPLHHHQHHPSHRLVRSRQEPLSEEICKTNRYWKQINETRDIYGQEVKVVHTPDYRQFAFVYECYSEGDSCSGISHQLLSTCEMRPGWASMLHVKLAGGDAGRMSPQWGYVAVPHHCACRIYPRPNPFVT